MLGCHSRGKVIIVREIVYQIVRDVGLIGQVVLTIVSGTADLIAILGLLRGERIVSKKIAWSCMVVISTLVCAGSIYGYFLSEVPDVTGYAYEDAIRKIAHADLKYDLLSADGLYVKEQAIAPGTIVYKGAQIDLITEEISSSDKVISEFEDMINADYGTLALNLHEIRILFKDEHRTVTYFGPKIDAISIIDAFLYQDEYCVKYNDFVVKDNLLIFNRIPKGIEFKLTVLAEGYEEVSDKAVSVSSEHTENDVYELHFGLMGRKEEFGLASSFRVVDERGNFLEDVDVQIKWEHENMWYGYYNTDRDGCLEYMIWLGHDQMADICVVNPFRNGVDYHCKVNLHKYISGDMVDDDIIIVSKSGECHVVKSSKYFGHP